MAVLVEEERKKDAEMGKEIAKVLEGFVRRKVIKQTVMTTVYGVTRYGARLQIEKQLKGMWMFHARTDSIFYFSIFVQIHHSSPNFLHNNNS